MGWHFNSYALVLFICALATVWVAVYAWRERALIGAGPAFTLLGITIWSLSYAVATGVHDLTWRIFWAKAQHLGIALTAVAMAVFAIHYSGHEKWLTRRNLVLLSAVPTAGLLLTWSNELHGRIWAQIELRIVGPLALLDIVYGPYFWFYFAYNYLILLSSALVFLHAALRPPHLQRRQAIILLIGTLCPGIALAIYLAGLSPLPGLDLGPLGYSIGSLVLAWGLFRYHLFEIVPVARDKVIENMIDAVFVLDAQSRIVDANPAMLRLVGRSPGKTIGQPIAQILSEQPDLIERYGNVPEAQGQITVGEGEMQRYFDMSISPLYSRQNELTGRVIVLRDTTERRKGDQEREELISELDAFAHTVAHDLRAPLTSMIGYAELLETYRDSLPEEQRQESLHAIVWGGRKISNIINELLLLSSIRKEEVLIRPLDMEHILTEALQRLGWMIDEHRAEIVKPDRWPTALGYDPWVEAVWVNYLSNAIKYGGQPPRVALGADLMENSMVRFWVRDNGLGIPAEDQARLFTPFTRVGRTRSKGQGLGLSIVRHIVEKLGGGVGLESTVGQGSLFYFTLPEAAEPVGEE